MKSNVASVRRKQQEMRSIHFSVTHVCPYIALRVQLLRVRVFSVLLYSAESWDLSDDSLCRTLKHFGRRCMATLMKKEVQFISAKECSMADPVNCNGTGKAM